MGCFSDILFLMTQKLKNKSILSLEKRRNFSWAIFGKICYGACAINCTGKWICLCACLYKHDCVGLIDKTARPMTTKLSIVVSYVDGKPCMKLHDPLITYTCEVMWQIKNKIFPLLQGLWPPNLARWWWVIVGITLQWSCMTHWSLVYLRSCHKLKIKYLLFSKCMATKLGRAMT